MPSLVGNKPNQVPTNGDLGTLAFQDANAVNITGGNATLGTATATTANITTGNITTAAISGGTATLGTLTANSVNLRVDHDISNISPSLLLDFANTKVLDPRITFTRATTATFYDGRTVAKAEENMLVRSQELDNTSIWTQTNVTIAANTGDTTAPDGTSTAERFTDDATNGVHRVSATSIPLIANTTYAASVFVKAGTHNFVQLLLRDGNTAERYITIVVNLSTGAITQTAAGTSSTLTSSAITNVGNNWFRIQMVGSFTAVGTAVQNQFQIAFAGAATGNTIGTFGTIGYVGTGTTFYAWGAQVEQRSAVTAYTPTTTEPITNYIPALQTAASGVARFDHNPITQESLGLLIEEQRTNLVVRSDDFANASWTKSRSSIVSNTIVAPDGTLTGDKLVEDTTATNSHLAVISTSLDRATQRAISFYVKAAERTMVCIQDNAFSSNFIRCFFNLSTLATTTFQSGNGIVNSASITAVGNGWYRCVLVGTPNTVSGGTTDTSIILAVNNFDFNYTGDGYSGLYIWGAQLEAGAFPTSYIPTVASTVTRNADAASMTGVNFSSWYNAREGTLYADFIKSNNAVSGRIVTISNGTTNNQIRINGSIGTNVRPDWQVLDGGNVQANITDGTAVTAGSAIKSIGAYAVNSFSLSTNSVLGTADTSGTVPVVSQMQIGANEAGAGFLNGTIKKIAYFPLRLPNAELIEMTT